MVDHYDVNEKEVDTEFDEEAFPSDVASAEDRAQANHIELGLMKFQVYDENQMLSRARC